MGGCNGCKPASSLRHPSNKVRADAHAGHAGTVVRVSAAAPEARKRPEYIPNRIDDPNYVSAASDGMRCHVDPAAAGLAHVLCGLRFLF